MRALIQSKGYTLTRILFLRMVKPIVLLAGFVAALNLILLLTRVNTETCVFAYEQIISLAGIRYLLIGVFAIFAVLAGLRIYSDNFRSGGVYTTLLLPMKRRHVFFSYWVVGVVFLLILWTAFTLSLMLGYPLVTAACQSTAESLRGPVDAYGNATRLIPFDVIRTNGLFLAAIRSDVFRILLPQTFMELLASLTLLLFVSVLPAATVLGIPKKAAPFFAGGGLLLMGFALYYRQVSDYFYQYGTDKSTFFTLHTIMLLMLAGAIAISVWRLNRDANL